ncbi:MAG: DsbA family protein [Gemmatimonadetes bacterium]|nr:DsbA family protein [Gemmatimonadota bacterium]
MAKATPKKKSNVGFIAIIAIVLVAGGAAIWTSMQSAKPKAMDVAASDLPAAKGYLKGDPNAPITIVEYADFECPGCGRFATVEEPDLQARVIDKGLANFKFVDFPLTQIHGNTLAAHMAAACADEQGKFWQMHDKLFAGQFDWNTQATANPRKFFDGYAGEIQLDMKKFGECFDSQRPLPQIQANMQEGAAKGVGGTPTILIGTKIYNPVPNTDGIIKILDSLRAAGAIPAAAAPAGDTTKK